ncbi:hypothetical protein ACI3PL_29470, partial [Lacticaseibacillus paracasei]
MTHAATASVDLIRRILMILRATLSEHDVSFSEVRSFSRDACVDAARGAIAARLCIIGLSNT